MLPKIKKKKKKKKKNREKYFEWRETSDDKIKV